MTLTHLAHCLALSSERRRGELVLGRDHAAHALLASWSLLGVGAALGCVVSEEREDAW